MLFKILVFLCFGFGLDVNAQNFSKDFKKKWIAYIFPDPKDTDPKISGCEASPAEGRKIQIDPKKKDTLLEERWVLSRPSQEQKIYYNQDISVRVIRHKKVRIPEEYDLVTFLAVKEWMQHGGMATTNVVDFILARYLAKKGRVLRLRKSIAGDEQKFIGFSKILENELLRMYSSDKVDEDSNFYEGIARPSCQLHFSDAPPATKDWEFQGIPAIAPKLKEKAVGKSKYFFPKRILDMTHKSIYTMSEDSIFYSYLPKKVFQFSYKENNYVCFERHGKREVSSKQERHIIDQNDSKGLVSESDHIEFGKIYRKMNDPKIKEYYETVVESYRLAKSTKSPPTEGDFKKSLPVLYILDPLSRAYQCLAKNLEADYSAFVEPLIYVYTQRPRSVTVALDPQVYIRASEPPHENNEWVVLSNSKGELWHNGLEKYFSSLFWEGRKQNFPKPPNTGQLVKAENLAAFFDRNLKDFGLNQKEIRDFKQFWVPELQRYDQLLIDFLINTEIDEYVTLRTSPPMHQIRVYLNYLPVESGGIAYKKKEFKSIERPQGDVLVEWGGVRWSSHETF